MIAQTLEFAAGLGEVHLLAFGDAPQKPAPDHIHSSAMLGMSGMSSIAGSLISRPLVPLQSHLFLNGKATREVMSAVDRIRPDVIIFDMARLSPLADVIHRRHPGIRLVLDMDDRLSKRYQRMLANGSAGGLGGTFEAKLPRLVRFLVPKLKTLLLSLERRLMVRCERRAAQRFDAILMVSALEAEEMRADCAGKADVIAFPPLINELPVPQQDFSRSVRFVFIGNAGYAPNAEALELLDRAAVKVSQAAGSEMAAFRFQAAGKPLADAAYHVVEAVGFVPDLSAFLSGDAVLVAPILQGTGIKTKIIDALEHSVPVITTPVGAEGLGLTQGEHYICVQGEADLARACLDIIQSAEARNGLAGMAAAAREKGLTTQNRNILNTRLASALGL
ncbi:MAG: glycosyltransferase family 4 protein [Hyphomonas sp.]